MTRSRRHASEEPRQLQSSDLAADAEVIARRGLRVIAITGHAPCGQTRDDVCPLPQRSRRLSDVKRHWTSQKSELSRLRLNYKFPRLMWFKSIE